MEIKIEHITNLLKVISWIKLAQLFMLIAIFGLSYGFWENRIIIYNSIKVGTTYDSSSPLYIVLSKDSINYIDSTTVKSRTFMAGVQVVSVDFKKNSRDTTYFSIPDANLKNSYDAFLENKIAVTPLFTNNEINNQHIIDLINGEFVCLPFSSALASKLYRGADSTVKFMCSMSIPPYYGRFSGYMNVYLYKEPTADEIIIIRSLIRDISLRIYEHDINNSSAYKSVK